MSVATSPTNVASVSKYKQRLFRSRPEDTLPLTIEHQRIYILPTRRGIAFLFSLLLMLVASVNYALSLGYALCFLLTGLFAASLLHTYKNVAGLTVQGLTSEDAFCSGTVSFIITLLNNSSLDRTGVVLKTNRCETSIDIPSEKQAIATLNCRATSRGIHKLGRVTVTSTYPLGLWRTWCYLHTDAQALVYPKPESSPPPAPIQLQSSDGDHARRSNQGDIDGLREYQPGDAIASIAWKAAARGQGLFVKTFEQTTTGGEIHLSLAATAVAEVEQQLSRLCAWVLAAEQNQADYSLELTGVQLDLGHGHTQKTKALAALAMHEQKL